MKITFTRGTCLGGVGNDAYPGDVRDLPDGQAKQLIAAGRAVAGGELKKPAPAKSGKPAAVIDPQPGTAVENEEPK